MTALRTESPARERISEHPEKSVRRHLFFHGPPRDLQVVGFPEQARAGGEILRTRSTGYGFPIDLRREDKPGKPEAIAISLIFAKTFFTGPLHSAKSEIKNGN